jgi:hypothetical protein
MEHWWSGGQDNLTSWALDTLRGQALPSYQLTDQREQRPPILKMDLSAMRRSDSGVLDFSIPSRIAATLNDVAGKRESRVVDIIRAVALGEDSRKLERVTEPSGSVAAELVSSIESTVVGRNNTSVVGPGGRAIVYRLMNGSLASEVVVRRREGEVASQWKDIRDILRRLNEISSHAEALTISATYGYFELSKYELQLLMRPVFIFVIDGHSAVSGAPDWRQTIVEPVTYSARLSDEEGLGAWLE